MSYHGFGSPFSLGGALSKALASAKVTTPTPATPYSARGGIVTCNGIPTRGVPTSVKYGRGSTSSIFGGRSSTPTCTTSPAVVTNAATGQVTVIPPAPVRSREELLNEQQHKAALVAAGVPEDVAATVAAPVDKEKIRHAEMVTSALVMQQGMDPKDAAAIATTAAQLNVDEKRAVDALIKQVEQAQPNAVVTLQSPAGADKIKAAAIASGARTEEAVTKALIEAGVIAPPEQLTQLQLALSQAQGLLPGRPSSSSSGSGRSIAPLLLVAAAAAALFLFRRG